ncbi:velvet factor [Globomyces pollinis-pini]|nr:velvet factor [Globomyces pollinis-pini]
MVTVNLWSIDESNQPLRELHTDLVGNIIAESRVLEDVDGFKKIYFIFPNVYVRKEGRYRLCFRLIKIFGPTHDRLLPYTSVMDTIFSNVIQVYLPKHFPGKSKPSMLMKVLVKQTNDLKSRNL